MPLNGDAHNQGILNFQPTVSGGTWVDGKIGKCFNGGGTGYITLNTDITIQNEFTVSLWVKVNSYNASWARIFDFTKSANEYMGLCYSNDGTIGFHIYDSIDGTKKSLTDGYYWTSDIGIWTHIAITGSGNMITRYSNGVLINSMPINNASSFNDTYSVCRICAYGTSANNKANCCVSDFRVYDNALSAQEIKKLSQGLVLHLPLSRKGFGMDNIVQNTATSVTVPTTNSYTAYDITRQKPTTMDAKQMLLRACDEGLTLSYDVYCPGVYCDTTKSMMRIGCYEYFSIKENSTGTSKAFYGHHSISGTATNKNTLNKTNSLNSISSGATSSNPDVSFKGHYSRTIFPKQNANVLALYNNPDDYTVTGGYINIDIRGAYIKDASYIRNIHLEFGEKETPWSLHPDDTINSQMGLDDNIHKDISGYQHNATLNNITYSIDTPFNEMCSVFNGSNSYVKVNDNTWMVDKASELTVNFWAYSSNWASVTNGGRMVSCTEGGGFNLEGGSTGYIRFPRYVYTNAEQTTKAYQYSNTGIKLADLTTGWHMFTLVYNASGEKIYIDGNLHSEASYTSYGLSFNKNARLYLGCEASGANPTTPYFNGRMSDFRIYYTALSADEVLDLYEKR